MKKLKRPHGQRELGISSNGGKDAERIKSMDA